MLVHSGSHWYVLVEAETQRQSNEWDDNIKPEIWGNVLNEEVGEVSKAIIDGDLAHAREEIVQVAAICHRMFHSLERAEAAGWQPFWQTKPRSKNAP